MVVDDEAAVAEEEEGLLLVLPARMEICACPRSIQACAVTLDCAPYLNVRSVTRSCQYAKVLLLCKAVVATEGDTATLVVVVAVAELVVVFCCNGGGEGDDNDEDGEVWCTIGLFPFPADS